MNPQLPEPQRAAMPARAWPVAALALSLLLGAGAPAIAQPAATAAAKPVPAAASARPAQGAIEGVVNRVTDGDSLWLQPAGRAPIEVRLRDIDAPEICQDYGPDAKRALEQFALGKTAQLTTHGKDGHGRTIGTVVIDGQSVSKWMVGEGHAWSTRFRSDRGPLLKEERMATALRRGVHATSEPQKPWDFRKLHGPCK
jgi:endonuclease YncB( thermonuclease family)